MASTRISFSGYFLKSVVSMVENGNTLALSGIFAGVPRHVVMMTFLNTFRMTQRRRDIFFPSSTNPRNHLSIIPW